MRPVLAPLVIVVLGIAGAAAAQPLLVDRPQRASGLWCFQSADDPHEWRYVPARARLATSDDGKPEFSFIRYAKSAAAPSNDATAATIQETDGGGVFHMLVLYQTLPQEIARARAQLREQTKDDDLQLAGPVNFSSGRYAVISSILRAGAPVENDTPVRRLLDTGAAPVLEGNKIALSFDLDKTQASLLNASLKMKNPDVSITFDMEFSGITNGYDATIDADWSQISHSEKIGGGVKVVWIGADVKVAVESLVRNGAVKITSRGEDAASEAMMSAAYAKIVELMFQPTRESPPAGNVGGSLGQILGGLGGGSSLGASYFNLYASYELKDLRSSGHTVLSLNHRATTRRHALITVNIGDIYTKYGSDPAFFGTVNLVSDRVFQKRKVYVSLDGAIIPEFDNLLNSVAVTLRKKHGDGSMTIGETLILKSQATAAAEQSAAGNLAMTYGYSGDEDAEKWLAYEYRTKWSFQGGAAYESAWSSSNGPMISVFTPYEHRVVQILGDADALKARRVSYVSVHLSYPFFGTQKGQQWTYRVGKEAAEHVFDVTRPANEYATQVTLTWHFEDGREITTTRSDSSGIVLIDEIPPNPNT